MKFLILLYRQILSILKALCLSLFSFISIQAQCVLSLNEAATTEGQQVNTCLLGTPTKQGGN